MHLEKGRTAPKGQDNAFRVPSEINGKFEIGLYGAESEKTVTIKDANIHEVGRWLDEDEEEPLQTQITLRVTSSQGDRLQKKIMSRGIDDAERALRFAAALAALLDKTRPEEALIILGEDTAKLKETRAILLIPDGHDLQGWIRNPTPAIPDDDHVFFSVVATDAFYRQLYSALGKLKMLHTVRGIKVITPPCCECGTLMRLSKGAYRCTNAAHKT